jgi:hypothetical protein
MSAIKPILLATFPIYAMMSLMIITMAAVYEVVEDIAVNHPDYSLSALSLLFFAMIMMVIVPSVVTSRFMKRYNPQDARIQLPAHWRTVILDVVAWVRTHVYSQMLLMFGFMGVFGALSGAAIYSLRAIQASTLDYLIVILAGAFVGLFAFSTGRVLYRSALAPVDAVPDDGLDSIVRALPVMGPRRIEFLKKGRSDVLSPKAKKLMDRLYALGAAGLGISAAAPFVGFPSLAVPGILFATIMMMLAMVVVFASAIGNRRSVLSRALTPEWREVDKK